MEIHILWNENKLTIKKIVLNTFFLNFKYKTAFVTKKKNNLISNIRLKKK